VITNRAPSIVNISIAPLPLSETQDVHVESFNFSDDDGQTNQSQQCIWYVNNVFVSGESYFENGIRDALLRQGFGGQARYEIRFFKEVIQMNKTTIIYMGFTVLGALFFFLIGYVLRKYTARMKVKRAEERSKAIVEEAKKEAESRKREAQLEAKDLLLKLRSDFERESKERRRELGKLERRISQREENLDRRIDILDKKEKEGESSLRQLVAKENEIQEKNKALSRLLQEEKERLQRVSGMTVDEAKRILMKRLENDVKQESAHMIKRMEEEAREKADKEARKIVGLAIQKCAADHTVETNISVVNLPSDDIKGRIIVR